MNKDWRKEVLAGAEKKWKEVSERTDAAGALARKHPTEFLNACIKEIVREKIRSGSAPCLR